MYYYIKNGATAICLFAAISLIFVVIALKALHINTWFSLGYFIAFWLVSCYFRYINQYLVPFQRVVMILIILPSLLLVSIGLCLGGIEAFGELISFDFMKSSFLFFLCLSIIVIFHLLVITLWVHLIYLRDWSQTPPAWITKNAQIIGDRLSIEYNSGGAALGALMAGLASVVTIALKMFANNQIISTYIIAVFSLPIVLFLTRLIASKLNEYFQLRKIEKQRGIRFIFGDIEEIQKERSKSWLGRLINPALRPIYAELKLEAAQPIPAIPIYNQGIHKKVKHKH